MLTGPTSLVPPNCPFNPSSQPAPIGTDQLQPGPEQSPTKPDPVKLLAPVMVLYLPVGPRETDTMIGLWFTTVGVLNIYIQQAIDKVMRRIRAKTPQ